MRIVIIEDETAAAVNLSAILRNIGADVEIVVTLESVADSVDWLQRNPQPDLLLMDIHLADGEAFRIFDQVEITAPIIFTTAYDRYALEAFKVNSIDYLLKPINEVDLRRAFDKLNRLTHSERVAYRNNVEALVAKQRECCQAFLVHVKDKIIPLKLDDIAFCYTFNEKVSAYTFGGGVYQIDRTLESLQEVMPANDYFRANRQYIISRRAIKDISVWFGSRLSLNLTVEIPEKIIISKARVPEFKGWLVAVQPAK